MLTFLKYAAAAFLLAVMAIIYAILSPKVQLGFLQSLYLLVAAPVLIGSGAFIGHLVRDFTRPDYLLTTGLDDTFKKKLFWKAGPQLIGAFIGMMAVEGSMQNLFRPAPSATVDAVAQPVHDEPAAPMQTRYPPEEEFEMAGRIAETPAAEAESSRAAEDSARIAQLEAELAMARLDSAQQQAIADAQSEADDVAREPHETPNPQRPSTGYGAQLDQMASNTVGSAPEPSFDCVQASTEVEVLICSDAHLSSLDSRLADLYRSVLHGTVDRDSVVTGQREWIAGVRDNCREVDCLAQAYETRIDQLSSM